MGAIKDKRMLIGGMNQDIDPRMLPDGDYIEALNMLIGNSEASNTGDGESLLGNNIVDFSTAVGWTQSGLDRIIGFCEDKANSTILFFVYNGAPIGHGIFEYNINTRDIRGIVRSPNLNFQLDAPILDANIIEGDLYFTDGVNPPRGFNIDRAHDTIVGGTNPYPGFTQEVLNNGTQPPPNRPEVEFVDDGTLPTNLLRNNTYKFRSQFIYYNDQRSVLSPISEVPVRDVDQNPFDDLLQQNKIEVTVDTGTLDLVKEIVVYVQVDNLEWGAWKTIERDTLGPVSQTVVDFIGNEGVEYIEDKIADKNYDAIPRLAQTQDFIGETYLIYGNITEGYEDPENLQTVPSFNRSGLIPAPIRGFATKDYIFKTWKRRGVYKVGIKYKDEYGRESGVLDIKSISVPRHVEEQSGNVIYDLFFRYQLLYDIYHEPPSWATQAHVVISQNQTSLNYIQFADFGTVLKDEYLQFTKAIPYDISAGDEVRIIHRYEPFDPSQPFFNQDALIEYLDANVEGNLLTITKVEGDRFYYDTNVEFDLVLNHLYFFEISTPAKTFDEIQFKEIGRSIEIGFDAVSGKYTHLCDTPQTWNPNGTLNQFGRMIINEGDTFLQIQQLQYTISTEGRLHKVIGAASPTGDDPGVHISSIDLPPDAQWNPLDDISVYFPDSSAQGAGDGNAFLRWKGQPTTGPSGNDDLFDGTRAFENNYDQEREYVNLLTNVTDPMVTGYAEHDPENVWFEWKPEKYWVIERPNQYSGRAGNAGNDLGRIGVEIDQDSFKQKQITKLRYSNRYFEGTSINGLATFDFDDVEYLTEEFGPIVRMVTQGEVLKLFQHRKVTSIYIGRSELETLDGQTAVTRSNRLLGQIRKSKSIYGCYHPESIRLSDRYVYFYDALEGQMCIATENGVKSISEDNGMEDYWRDLGRDIVNVGYSSARIICGIDSKYNQVVWNINFGERNETIVFDEKNGRWRTFMSYLPDWMANSGQHFVTAKNENIYVHNEGDPLTWYGVKYSAKLTLCFAQYSELNKVFLNIRISSNRRWSVPLITTIERFLNDSIVDYKKIIESELLKENFDNVEGMWVASFLKNKKSPGYPTEELALINGEELIADALICELEYDGNETVIINHVIVESNESMYNT